MVHHERPIPGHVWFTFPWDPLGLGPTLVRLDLVKIHPHVWSKDTMTWWGPSHLVWKENGLPCTSRQLDRLENEDGFRGECRSRSKHSSCPRGHNEPGMQTKSIRPSIRTAHQDHMDCRGGIRHQAIVGNQRYETYDGLLLMG